MDSELLWPTAAELEQAATLRGQVDLSGCPEDVSHDLNIVRFLRGNDHDLEVARTKMQDMVDFRRSNGLADLGAIRAALGEVATMSEDLRAIPHAEDLLAWAPFQLQTTGSRDGLPMMFVQPRYVDAERLGALAPEVFAAFMVGIFEHRSMLLHKMSIEQHRMMKVLDIRDLTDVGVTEIFSKVVPILKQIKGVLAVVQDFYPEVIHKAVVINAPSTFANVFSIVAVLLNERMKSKISILGPTTPFPEVAAHFSSSGMREWLGYRPPYQDPVPERPSSEFEEVAVAASSMTWHHFWLPAAGASCVWLAKVAAKNIRVAAYFLQEGKELQLVSEVKVEAGEDHSGRFEAPSPGCFVLVLDNASSWFTGKDVSIKLAAG